MADPIDVLVTLSSFSESSSAPRDALDRSGLEYRLNTSGRRMTPAEVVDQASDCLGIIAGVEPYDADTLSRLPQLRCISRCGVGTESIDHAEAARRGIAILNTPDEPIAAVAEMTLALMLAMLRQIPALDASVKSRKWKRVTGRLLQGKTVGLVGLGRIGRRVAELLQPFGVRLVAYDPFADPSASRKAAGIEMVELGTLLGEADIVSLHASSNAQSPLRLGRAELHSMKEGAWLVNVARGQMVDDHVLAELLETGRLSGAALDVFPEEPYSGPLCDSERVLLSPHQATLTEETRNAMELKAVENLVAFLRSAPAKDERRAGTG